jgi:hypothetical protein
MTITTTRKKLLSLLISQALIASTQAATVDINCGEAIEFVNAINTANSNNETDTINLNADNQANCVYLLTEVNNTTNGANGLPAITTPIIINGNHSAIRRQDGSDDFRIVYVTSTGSLTLKQLSIENGIANSQGGGIFNRGELMLTDSTVSGNTTTISSNGGGGIFNAYPGATATLTNSTVVGNHSNGDGGGISNSWGATATLTNSTVVGNTSSDDYVGGGGISNFDHSTLMLTNSTVVENTAGSWGGGIANRIESSVTLRNSIVAGNTAMDCTNNQSSTFTTNHNNLFSGDGTCNVGTTDLTLAGLGKSITDLLNPTLADNGGPTQTLALVENSPAIDVADNAICPPTDQRGVSRPQGTACDIGAFEYQSIEISPVVEIQQQTNAPNQAGLKMTCNYDGNYGSECPVITWNGYTYWAYSYIDNRVSLDVIAYDCNGNLVQQWEKPGTRYIQSITVDNNTKTVSFIGQYPDPVVMNWTELELPPITCDEVGPNGGDANNDGIPDSQQDNVASVLSVNDAYITLETASNLQLNNIIVSRETDYAELDSAYDFPQGIIGFQVQADSAPIKLYYYGLDSAAESFVSSGLITEAEKDVVVSEAGGSSCGHKN